MSGIAQRLQAFDPFRPRYGTWRGAVLLFLSRLSLARGAFSGPASVRWSEVERLVFVCRGNICRSAYADVRAKAMGLAAASFGLKGTDGQPAYVEAQRAAAKRHVDLSAHRTTDVTSFTLRKGDLLLAMEPRHLPWIRSALAGAAVPHQVTLLGLWSRPRRPHVHDPHILDAEYFATCFDIIDSALAGIAEKWHGAR